VTRRSKKMILMGMDGLMYYLLMKFAGEGRMPNVSRLIENGSFGEASQEFPSDTPTNWTSIATGAATGTHGITGFRIHLPGEPLDVGQFQENEHRCFESTYCNAEYLWDTADRAAIKCLVINYPTCWPPTFRAGMMIKGDGIPPLKIADSMYYVSVNSTNVSNRPYSVVHVKEAKERETPTTSYSPLLEADIQIESELIAQTPPLEVLLIDAHRRGYDALAVGDEVIGIGQSTKWIKMQSRLTKDRSALPEEVRKAGSVTGLFKLHLVKISPDATNFEVLRTPIFITQGWTYPANLGEDLLENVDALRSVRQEYEDPYNVLFSPDGSRDRLGSEALSERRANYLIQAQYQAERLSQIIAYLKSYPGWDLCFFHYHLLDSVNHRLLGHLSPLHPAYTQDKLNEAMREYEAAYMMVDELAGKVLNDCADDETLVVLVSDHAALPCWKIVRIHRAFIRAGLLTYEWHPEKGKYVVDLSRTKAFPWVEPTYVWVNLKGRDPGGIVQPEDYESVRERSIEALMSIRDPDTGKCPIAIALKKEQAYFMRQFGERVGDVVYALSPGYQLWDTRIEDEWSHEIFPDVFKEREVSPSIRVTGDHDQHLPLDKIGTLSNTPALIMAGPGVRRNHRLSRPAMLVDVAPTIAKLLGIPAPAQAEGNVIWEALEPPES